LCQYNNNSLILDGGDACLYFPRLIYTLYMGDICVKDVKPQN